MAVSLAYRRLTSRLLSKDDIPSSFIKRRSFASSIRTKPGTCAATQSIYHKQGFLQFHKQLTHINSVRRKEFHTSGGLLQSQDLYIILGVTRNASASEIKKAYYELAKKFHPDTNKEKGAAEKFQDVQRAYEVLSDADKRSTYDITGQDNFQAGAGGGQAGGGNPFGGQDPFRNVNPEDIFKQFFGDQKKAGGFSGFSGFEEARTSQNIGVTLTFMEAVRGIEKDIRVRTRVSCNRCDGRKAEPGSTLQTCSRCKGSGNEEVSANVFGWTMQTPCRACGGQGHIVKDPCRKCSGKGALNENKNVTVPVPAGIEDGQILRVPIPNSYGEIFVTCKVQDSKIFERDGADVHSDVSLHFAQAILGGSINVPGLLGDIDLKIPAGTQSHQKIRMIGKGIPRLNGYGKGDHYMHIKIHLPKFLTEEQKKYMVSFAESDDSVRGSITGVDKERRTRDEEARRRAEADWIAAEEARNHDDKNNNQSNKSETNDANKQETVEESPPQEPPEEGVFERFKRRVSGKETKSNQEEGEKPTPVKMKARN